VKTRERSGVKRITTPMKRWSPPERRRRQRPSPEPRGPRIPRPRLAAGGSKVGSCWSLLRSPACQFGLTATKCVQVPVCRLDPVGRRPGIFLGGSRDFVELGLVSLRDTWQNPYVRSEFGAHAIYKRCRAPPGELAYTNVGFRHASRAGRENGRDRIG
jgi:hypothetical protein